MTTRGNPYPQQEVFGIARYDKEEMCKFDEHLSVVFCARDIKQSKCYVSKWKITCVFMFILEFF